MPEAVINCFIAGELTRDYIVKSEHDYALDKPGGHALYAAGGMLLWQECPGMLSLVGEDYPQDWIEQFTQTGIDVRGIQILPETRDHRRFYGYLEDNELQLENPITYFDTVQLPFPKSLIGYHPQKNILDNRTSNIPGFCRLKDIPSSYLDCPSAHLCPMDFQSHMILPDALRQGHVSTISIDASSTYMDPLFLDQIPYLVNHVTVFHISESNIRELFRNRKRDLWDMVETVGNYGCEVLVLHKADHSYFLYNAASHEKWIIPPYPLEVTNVIGVEDAFCGGFLANYRKTFDPVEAAVYGAVSASYIQQGFAPFYGLESYSGLTEMRLEKIKVMVRKL